MPYQSLLSPGRIGALELRNRIVVTAMGVNFAAEGGHWSERVRTYHEEQARGGAALVISGACGVMYPIGQVQPWQIAISEDEHMAGIERVVEAVHRHGARLAVQLHQGGLNAVDDTASGRPLWCPSEPEPYSGDFLQGLLLSEFKTFASTGMPTYRVMTKEDIRNLVLAFAAGAARAKAVGCDAVEVHGGHGYVPSSFLSPRSNRRTDEYGGRLENRARLLLEITRAVRGEVGPGYPVIVKIDSREVGREGGITLDDARITAQWLEAAGADAITVSAYHDFGQGKMHSASNIPHEPNWNLDAAAAIKGEVGVPIIASGRVEPEHADGQIRAGRFDFLAMGRKLLADPHLPRKLAEGRAREVRPCIYCYTCVSAIYTRESMRCTVNPECGLEDQRSDAGTAAAPRRIVVVGGGPAGMEAARRLSLLGHTVVLIEKGDRLGGTLRFASLVHPANERLLDWLCEQIEASGVDVRLSTVATPELLRSIEPDEVVVATGATRSVPAIPGADRPHVLGGDDLRDLMLGASSEALGQKTSLVTRIATRAGAATGLTKSLEFVRKASRAWMPIGREVVILGGELVGLELAEFLIERGRRVSVLEEGPRLGAGLAVVRRLRMLADLREHGAGLYAGVQEVRIEADCVCFTDASGRAQRIHADHVIVAMGTAGDSAQAERFGAAGLRVHEIGDGRGIGYIEGAMRDAMEVVDAIQG